MMSSTRLLVALCFVLAAMGFLLPFWPLSALGILIAALAGRFLFAIGVGLLLDIAYGTPVGTLQVLWFPFTLFAVISLILRLLAKRYLMGRGQPETL